jgi:hypothetical protein
VKKAAAILRPDLAPRIAIMQQGYYNPPQVCVILM